MSPTLDVNIQSSVDELVSIYRKNLWIPIILATIFEIAALHNNNTTLLTIIANGVLIFLTISIGIRHHHPWYVVGIAGGIIGGSSTFFYTFFRAIEHHTLVEIFRLATTTIITSVTDTLLAGLGIILLTIFHRFRQQYSNEKLVKK